METKKLKKLKSAGAAGGEPSVNRAVDDPHGLARSWLASLEGRGHGVRVVHHRGEFLLWEGDAYREVNAGDLRGQLTRHAEREFKRANEKAMDVWAGRAKKDDKPPVMKKVGTRLIGDVLQAMAGECGLSADIDPPTWVTDAGTVDRDRGADDDPRMMLATPGGVLDLVAAASGGENCLHPPTPHFFTRAAVGYDYSADAEAPGWAKFLKQVFGVVEAPGDEKAKKANKAGRANIRALRQWFGYLLTADTRQQKILMLLGLPRSGKGTIVRVLTQLLGGTNVGSVKLEALGSRFGLWPLRDKPVGVIADLRLSERADRSAIVETLLSVSGEDAQPVEQKFHNSFTARIGTRFVIVSNEVPRLADASAALASRLVVVRTARSFLGVEDTTLEGKLIAELPGILNWALAGLTDLKVNGKFSQPSSGKEDLRSLRDMASPVGAFLRDRCKLDPAERTETGELYDAYGRWAGEEGRKYTPTKEQFGRDLRAVAAIDRKQKRCKLTGKQKPCYVGVKLLPE